MSGDLKEASSDDELAGALVNGVGELACVAVLGLDCATVVATISVAASSYPGSPQPTVVPSELP